MQYSNLPVARQIWWVMQQWAGTLAAGASVSDSAAFAVCSLLLAAGPANQWVVNVVDAAGQAVCW